MKLTAFLLLLTLLPVIALAKSTTHGKFQSDFLNQEKTYNDVNSKLVSRILSPEIRHYLHSLFGQVGKETPPHVKFVSGQITLTDTVKSYVIKIVNARDMRFTVNGRNFQIDHHSAKKSVESLARLMFQRQPKSYADLIISQANAERGFSPTQMAEAGFGYLASSFAAFPKYFTSCQGRAINNLLEKYHHLSSAFDLEYIGTVPVCGILAAVYPLSNFVDNQTDPLGLKNLLHDDGQLPVVKCPRETGGKLVVDFSDKSTVNKYTWYQKPDSTSLDRVVSEATIQGKLSSDTYFYPDPANHLVGQSVLNGVPQGGWFASQVVANTSEVAYKRFLALCNDPVRLKAYRARQAELERDEGKKQHGKSAPEPAQR